jgi:hypothetical protein
LIFDGESSAGLQKNLLHQRESISAPRKYSRKSSAARIIVPARHFLGVNAPLTTLCCKGGAQFWHGERHDHFQLDDRKHGNDAFDVVHVALPDASHAGQVRALA